LLLLLLLLMLTFDWFCAAVLTTVDLAFTRSLSGRQFTRWTPRRQSCRILHQHNTQSPY